MKTFTANALQEWRLLQNVVAADFCYYFPVIFNYSVMILNLMNYEKRRRRKHEVRRRSKQ